MLMMNVTAESAKYTYEGLVQMGEKLAKALKKYWENNHALITSGLSYLNGNASFNAYCC